MAPKKKNHTQYAIQRDSHIHFIYILKFARNYFAQLIDKRFRIHDWNGTIEENTQIKIKIA